MNKYLCNVIGTLMFGISHILIFTKYNIVLFNYIYCYYLWLLKHIEIFLWLNFYIISTKQSVCKLKNMDCNYYTNIADGYEKNCKNF